MRRREREREGRKQQLYRQTQAVTWPDGHVTWRQLTGQYGSLSLHPSASESDNSPTTTSVNNQFINHFVSVGGRSIAISVSVCLSVCLSIGISQKPPVQISRHMLLVAVARSSSNDVAISNVLPVLCMTSCFNTTVRIPWLGGSGRQQVTRHPLHEWYRLARSWQQAVLFGGADGGVVTGRGRSLPSVTALFIYAN